MASRVPECAQDYLKDLVSRCVYIDELAGCLKETGKQIKVSYFQQDNSREAGERGQLLVTGLWTA
jgi:hypothetical protein